MISELNLKRLYIYSVRAGNRTSLARVRLCTNAQAHRIHWGAALSSRVSTFMTAPCRPFEEPAFLLMKCIDRDGGAFRQGFLGLGISCSDDQNRKQQDQWNCNQRGRRVGNHQSIEMEVICIE